MAMYAKVRRMYFRDRMTISSIVQKTGLARNTVKKWINEPDSNKVKYHRKPKPKLITPYIPWLEQVLKADSHRPKRDRRTARQLFEDIQQQGFTGDYSRVTEFVQQWRAQGNTSTSAFVPLKFKLGEAFQFDWSEETIMVGGVVRKIQAAHTKLCSSRAFIISAYPAQSHEMLFDAHARAFTALGGVAQRGIYDNMKTAVDKVTKGNGRIVNTRFFAMVSHYLFDADFCNVASGWEKGIVEKNVQDARRRIWLEAKEQIFSTFDELNNWLEIKCRTLWSELPHPHYESVTVAEALAQEQSYLMPVPTLFDGYVEVNGRVSNTCLVTVDKNRYSVPSVFINRMMSIRLYPNRIDIYDDAGLVASHTRLFNRDQTSYQWQHYVPVAQRKPGVLRNGEPFEDMPAPFIKLQAALLRRDRQNGHRLMAKVLSAVTLHGVEAVIVAVELVLESGVHSAEHVLNVLARLNQQPTPTHVVTKLTLKEEPLADTARYESLADQEEVSDA